MSEAAGDLLVLLDLRRGAVTLPQMSALRRARAGVSLVAVVEPGTPVAKVYAAGALAAIPPDTEALVACIENLAESRRETVGGPDDPRSGVARLRRVFGDLRSGLISATVALNLMHIISESVERAVLFLVKRDLMVALGAFGTDRNGKSLAELTRGLKLSLELATAQVGMAFENELLRRQISQTK